MGARRKETLSSKIGLRHKSDKLLGGNNVDILGLDTAKDFLAFVEIEFLLAVVCQKRPQLPTASNGDGQVVNGPLEYFDQDPAWKGIGPNGGCPVKTDLLRAEGEEKFPGSRTVAGPHIELQTAFDAAAEKSIASGEDIRLDDVGFANECRDEPAGGPIVDFIDRAYLLHASAADHSNAVTHGESLLLIVCDKDKSDTQAFLQLLEFDSHLSSQLCIKGAERLVEQEDFRLADDGSCQSNPLTLASRKLCRLATDEFLE
jgi:hypothetical protein